MPTRESALSSRMVQVLRQRGAWAVKTHGDPRQRRGLPDIIACYRGQFIGIEVKRPGRERTLTKLQADTLEKIGKAEGLHYVFTEIGQVRGMLNWIDLELGDE